MAMHELPRDDGSFAHAADERFRGWFYRAVAIDPASRVLAIGAPFVGHWFANVVADTSLAGASARPATFDIVILHRTLGEQPTLERALQAIHGLLAVDGVAIVAGYNRLRRLAATQRSEPRSTKRGYLQAARATGFSDVRIYSARPDLDTMRLAVALEPASVTPFFGFQCAAARAAGRMRPAWLDRWYARAAPWLEHAYVVVARKC